MPVGIGQRVGNAFGNAGRLLRLGPPTVGQQVAQITPLQALHGDIDALL